MRALERLVAVLETVAAGRGPVSPSAVAGKIGLSLSTTSRLMGELAQEGMLELADGRGRYVLGPRLISLAHAALDGRDLAEVATPLLRDLRELTGETVALHVRRNGDRVCIANAESRHQVRRVVPVGATVPLHTGATGEVLLAFASPADV